MEKDGLVTRRATPRAGATTSIEITPAGEQPFTRLAAAARAFDELLRNSLGPVDLAALRELLDQLGAEP